MFDAVSLVPIRQAMATLSRIKAESEPIHDTFFPKSLATTLKRVFGLERKPDPASHLPELDALCARARILVEEAGAWYKSLEASASPGEVKMFGNACYYHVYYEASAVMLLKAYVNILATGGPGAHKRLAVMREFRQKGEERRQVVLLSLQSDVAAAAESELTSQKNPEAPVHWRQTRVRLALLPSSYAAWTRPWRNTVWPIFSEDEAKLVARDLLQAGFGVRHDAKLDAYLIREPGEQEEWKSWGQQGQFGKTYDMGAGQLEWEEVQD